MTKSNLPVGGYSVNPYVGCTHGCKYCYASFMKRFTGHTEPWGTFLDVKHWPEIKNPQKYRGQRVVIGSVTDGYLPQEEQFQNTRKLLEQLKDSGAEILICTKSDLVVRDIDLLREMGKVTVSWSINTLDEDFMDQAMAMTDGKGFGYVYETAGVTTTMKYAFELAANKAGVCFIGTPTRELSFSVEEWENINRKEFTLTGSWMSYSAPFPGKEWVLTAHYFKTGQLKFDESFVFKKMPLSKIDEAFEMYKTPGTVKGKILIDSEK